MRFDVLLAKVGEKYNNQRKQMLILQAYMEIWNNFYAFYRLNLFVFEVLVTTNQHSSMVSHGKFPACLLVQFTRAAVFKTVNVYLLSAFGIAQRDS